MEECNINYHIPVLLKESIKGLNIRADGKYVDVTFGGGGHSRAILSELGKNGKLYGFDQDADAEKNIHSDKRFIFIRSNFRFLTNFMDWHKVDSIDGLLADLGVSSHHFDDETRGFSFRFNGPADMRMNKRSSETAADILNKYPEDKLADVFFQYGELRNARQLARAIIKNRANKPIQDINDLLAIINPFFEKEREKKFLAQVFQALRIEVNEEIDALKEMLIQASSLVKPGGRLVVITYHSLEDRIVKNFFKTGNFEGIPDKDFYGNLRTPFKQINNKVIVPGEDEIAKNPRSRSAKLRIAEKI